MTARARRGRAAAPRPPGDLHPARLLGLCRAGRLGRRVVLLDETGSTNAVAMSAASAGAAEGTLVVAERQTAGKGRKGRFWVSTPGKSLTASLVLRPSRPGAALTAVFAFAAIRALRRFAPGLALKWPNDLYLRGRKLGGILAESRDGAVVLGFGVDVNDEARDLPPGRAGNAVSLRMAARRRVDRGAVLARILESFEEAYARFEAEGFAPFRPAVERLLLHRGKRVVLEDGTERRSGTLAGVTDEGYLVLETGGEEAVFASGDLTLREDSRGNDSRS